jgi:hypothetical protein
MMRVVAAAYLGTAVPDIPNLYLLAGEFKRYMQTLPDIYCKLSGGE